MSNYTKKVVTWEMVEAALDDIDARLAALEGKGGEARMATPDEIRQHDVGVVWEHIDALKEENAELERRLTEATAPTKRQQVAEAFLHAALLCPDGSETTYANLAYILATPESSFHNNTTRDMANVLHNEWKSGNNND